MRNYKHIKNLREYTETFHKSKTRRLYNFHIFASILLLNVLKLSICKCLLKS